MALRPDIQNVIEAGNTLFADKVSLHTHWQELAEHFYYERADFTQALTIGEDYASGSFASRAALYRREMGDLYRAMLRPVDFFQIKALDEGLNKRGDARSWLQYATNLQRAVMYRRGAMFSRATQTADHDHLTFGQAAIEIMPTRDRKSLFYRCWHLRDMAWSEDYTGAVDDVHRNCKAELATLRAMFPGTLPEALQKDASKNPRQKVMARHVVVPAGVYETGIKLRAGQDFVSLWVLPEHGVVLENIGRTYKGYVIPRGPTVSGSQYARSPFTSIILPDSRTQQAIERILLEAGEKTLDPPLVATMDVVRSDIGLGAGGITWLDRDYDERLGDAIRPLNAAYNPPFGEEMANRTDMTIRLGFMLDKVSIPDTKDMTAYQVRKVVEQQMRANIPMFEPVEVEYSEPLCAETFAVMRSLGAFPAQEIPDSLRGTDIEFSFKSPIKDLEDDSMRAKLMEGMEVLQVGAQLDPAVAQLPDAMEITKDLVRRIGWPESWIKDEKRLAPAVEQMQARMQAQEDAGAAAMVAEGAGKAAPMVKALMGNRAA